MADKGVHLFTIEGTITVTHHPAQKTLVGDWESLCTDKFREALQRAAIEAQRLGTRSWIADLRRSPGVPSQADQKWIEEQGAGESVRNGVRACINLHGASALSKLGATRWLKSASSNGMLTFECGTLEDALEIAAQVASGKAA
jgi:hypothetical protein